MENGKQISRISESKNIFLQQMEKVISEQKRYNVQDEFEKTRANRNWRVFLIIFLTMVSFALLSIIMNRIVQQRYEEANIDIATFQNSNLRELLNITKQLENDLNGAIDKKSELINEKSLKLGTLNTRFEQAIERLRNRRLSPAAFSREANNMRAEQEELIMLLDVEYDSLISEQDAIILSLRQDLNAYDSQQVEIAKQQEEILANERRLYTIEIEQLKESYESKIRNLTTSFETELQERRTYYTNTLRDVQQLHQNELAATTRRYNPTFPELRPVLEDSRFASESSVQADFTALQTNEFLSGEEVIQLQNDYRHLQELLQALQDTPYINDIPNVHQQLDLRFAHSVDAYHNMLETVSAMLTERNAEKQALNQQISRILFSLQTYSETNRENGYILDARDENDIMIFIDSFIPVGDQSVGYVFRAEDTLVGTVSLLPYKGYTRASLISYILPETTFQPFDSILVSWDDSGDPRKIFQGIPAELPLDEDGKPQEEGETAESEEFLELLEEKEAESAEGETSDTQSAGEPMEPAEPAESAGESMESAEPAESAGESMESAEPAESAGESMEPAEPAESAGESMEPAEPAESAGESMEPAEPAESAGESMEPAEPAESAGESMEPAEPAEPAESILEETNALRSIKEVEVY